MRTAIVGVMLLAMAGLASAETTITVGDFMCPEGTVLTFNVWVESDTPVEIGSCAFNIQVEDGTPGNGTITNITLPLFGIGHPGYFTNGGSEWPAIGMCDLLAPYGIYPNGILARVTLDTTGMATGYYHLHLNNTLNDDTTIYDIEAEPMDLTFINGSIIIND